MSPDQIVGTVQQAFDNARTRGLEGPSQDEWVLVLPRRFWEQHGQEALTASFRRIGIQHVELVDTAQSDPARAQLLIYAKGTWHTNHSLGETHPDCEGCQATP